MRLEKMEMGMEMDELLEAPGVRAGFRSAQATWSMRPATLL